MGIIDEKRARNYCPHDLATRMGAVKRVLESGWTAKRAKSYYHVSRTSLWRWRKRYDGTEASLADKSHKPRSEHPRKTPEAVSAKVAALHRRNPLDSSLDVWAKALSSGCGISYSTCLRILKKLDGYEPYKTNPKRRHGGKYHTPELPGEKWQVDVKFVPSECKAPGLGGSYYQYTYLDEATRKRYLHFADEHSMYETVRGLREAIAFFGYKPRTIQTDNGSEFADGGAHQAGGLGVLGGLALPARPPLRG